MMEVIIFIRTLNSKDMRKFFSKIITIASKHAPKAIGPYSQATLAPATANILYCSGNIGIDRSTGAMVDGDVVAETR